MWHEPTGRSIDYRWLLLHAAKVAVPTVPEITAVLKPPETWRFIGKKIPFVDAHDMCTGKSVYGADVQLAGMLTAMVVRCPSRSIFCLSSRATPVGPSIPWRW